MKIRIMLGATLVLAGLVYALYPAFTTGKPATLPENGTVLVTVTDMLSGKPISGAFISMRSTGLSLQTDDNGQVPLPLPTHAVDIHAVADGYHPAPPA